MLGYRRMSMVTLEQGLTIFFRSKSTMYTEACKTKHVQILQGEVNKNISTVSALLGMFWVSHTRSTGNWLLPDTMRYKRTKMQSISQAKEKVEKWNEKTWKCFIFSWKDQMILMIKFQWKSRKKMGYHIVVEKYRKKMEKSQSDALSNFTLQLPS